MTPRSFPLRVAAAGVAALLLAPAGWAQGTGAGSSTGTGAGSGTGTGTTTGGGRGSTGITTLPGNTTSPTSTTTPQPTQVNIPIFLMGQVRLEDGSIPPDLVTIERICNGIPHNAGYADAKGNFGIELGNETGIFQDASEGFGSSSQGSLMGSASSQTSGGISSNRGFNSQERQLSNCELRGKLPGYRSQSIILAGRRPMDNPDVGTILLHREGPNEGTIVSLTSLNAPKSAKKSFDKGMDLVKKNKPGDAFPNFQKAVEDYPTYAAAWTELGRIQAARGQRDEARFAFDTAIKADPKFVGPYLEMSYLAYVAKQWEDLAGLTGQVIKLDPFDYPQAYMLNALAHYTLHRTDAAEKSVKEADRLDTQHRFPQIAHLYGLIMAQRQQFALAADHLRTYLKLSPAADDLEVVKTQLDSFEKATSPAAVSKQ